MLLNGNETVTPQALIPLEDRHPEDGCTAYVSARVPALTGKLRGPLTVLHEGKLTSGQQVVIMSRPIRTPEEQFEWGSRYPGALFATEMSPIAAELQAE